MGADGKLSQLLQKRLSVLVIDNGIIAATLSYDGKTRCYRIGQDIKVALNGFKMDLLEQGDTIVSAETSEKCRYPLWESPSIPRAEQTTVTLSDSSQAITATYSSLFDTRAVALTGAESAKIGDRVTLSWSPATDSYDADNLQVVFALVNQSGITVAKGAEQITTLDNTLSFTLPPESPIGNGRFVVVGVARVQSSVCDGVDACVAEYRVAAVVDFTISN